MRVNKLQVFYVYKPGTCHSLSNLLSKMSLVLLDQNFSGWLFSFRELTLIPKCKGFDELHKRKYIQVINIANFSS
jgi:hypothetical protein